MTTDWSRRTSLGVLLAHSLVTQVVSFVLRPTITYRALELDVPVAWLGALSATFAVAPLVAALPAGALVDRVGERRMAVTGSLLLVAAAVVFLVLGDTVGMLVLGSVLLGIGHLCCIVAQQTYVANSWHGTGADRAFGHYTFAVSLGQTLAPGLIVLFGRGRTVPDTSALFASALVAAAVLVVLSVFFAGRTRGQFAAAHGPRGAGLMSVLRLPGLPGALLTSCVVLAATDITLIYLPALGAERSIPAGVVGALLAVRGVFSMASRLLLGSLVDRFGRRHLLVTCNLLSALCLFVFAIPTVPVPALFVVVAVLGLGLGVGQPLTMSWLAESTPAGLRGRAMSLRLVGNRAGQVVIPSLAGALAATTGAAGVLAATGVGLASVGVVASRLPLNRPDT